jgi:hypothetical protein
MDDKVSVSIKNARHVAALIPNAVVLKSEVAIDNPKASKMDNGLNQA